jgi:hypothetical protein
MRQFERMATEAADPALIKSLTTQALAYRKLAEERAERLHLGHPQPPTTLIAAELATVRHAEDVRRACADAAAADAAAVQDRARGQDVGLPCRWHHLSARNQNGSLHQGALRPAMSGPSCAT